MDQTTVTRNIKKLEKSGLVTTEAHPEDPRKKIVELSPTGKYVLAKAHPLWEKAQKEVMSRICIYIIDAFKQRMRQLNGGKFKGLAFI